MKREIDERDREINRKWRMVELMTCCGYSDQQIAEVVDYTPHYVCRLRLRMGWRKYRTDHFVRHQRRAA